ncbi:hypothetical protein B0G57_11984 [Trinickia symbiotica]|nr:hypothetical protein B0G57_11984 [Trinickia symbiotica]
MTPVPAYSGRVLIGFKEGERTCQYSMGLLALSAIRR